MRPHWVVAWVALLVVGAFVVLVYVTSGDQGAEGVAVLLERLISRLEPSLVLFGFYMNDVPDALADSARPRRCGHRLMAP